MFKNVAFGFDSKIMVLSVYVFFVCKASIKYSFANDCIENSVRFLEYASTLPAKVIGKSLGGVGKGLNSLLRSSSGSGGSPFAARTAFSAVYKNSKANSNVNSNKLPHAKLVIGQKNKFYCKLENLSAKNV